MQHGISCRECTDADQPLLFDIYLHTRLHELAITDWSSEQKSVFLRSQFEIQQRQFRLAYPDGDFLLILLHEQPVGRLYLSRSADAIHVIDIALLPPFRNSGIGTYVLGDIMQQALQTNIFVSLYVDKDSHALRLYQRLGFEICGDNGIRWQMQTRPRLQCG